MGRDIFISYSRWNLEQVKAIKNEIENATDVECWMDLNAIESGAQQFTQDIVEGINSCPVFIFILSEKSQLSKFALRELNFAMKKAEKDKQRHVVIVNIDGCEMSDEFDFMYGLTDTIAWNKQPQKEKLLRDLRRWTEKSEVKLEEDKNKTEEMFLKGKFLYDQENYTEAVIWFRKAADLGHAVAQYYLGECYEDGYGIHEDEAEATKWYRKAFSAFFTSAEQGDAEAQFYLGECYDYGCVVSEDEAEAVKWYRKAAEQGYAKAQYELGECYFIGHGVSPEDDEAAKWYRKAAEQGYAEAQSNLGWCYEMGKGVTQDYSEAFKWYHKAAEQGQTDAQYNLGLCYYYGQGVKQNKQEARKWLQKAADQGNKQAKDFLKNHSF